METITGNTVQENAMRSTDEELRHVQYSAQRSGYLIYQADKKFEIK